MILAVIYFFHSRAENTKHIAPPELVAIANAADLSGPNAPSASATNAVASASGMPTLDRARADLIREKLRELPPILPGAASATPAKSSDGLYPRMPDDSNSGTALKDYIRQRIKDDYVPLARSCYENALAKNSDLGGRVVMKFKIVGDRRVGGVVDSADVDPSSTIQDETFLTCVKESMMAVSFDAPADDKAVTVAYPLVFSNVEDGGDSD